MISSGRRRPRSRRRHRRRTSPSKARPGLRPVHPPPRARLGGRPLHRTPAAAWRGARRRPADPTVGMGTADPVRPRWSASTATWPPPATGGRSVVVGGRRPPGVSGAGSTSDRVTGVDNAWPVAREEIFGPSAWSSPLPTRPTPPVRIANARPSALSGAVFSRAPAPPTSSPAAWHRRGQPQRGAGVMSATLPFGGFKRSGLGPEMGEQLAGVLPDRRRSSSMPAEPPWHPPYRRLRAGRLRRAAPDLPGGGAPDHPFLCVEDGAVALGDLDRRKPPTRRRPPRPRRGGRPCSFRLGTTPRSSRPGRRLLAVPRW